MYANCDTSACRQMLSLIVRESPPPLKKEVNEMKTSLVSRDFNTGTYHEETTDNNGQILPLLMSIKTTKKK